MKKLIILLSIFTLLIACKFENKESKTPDSTEIKPKLDESYSSFGEKISDKNLLSKKEIIETYKNLKVGDTAIVKFAAKVNDVCQSKGCWMRLSIGDEEAMVKFKNYGFFMPKNIADKDCILFMWTTYPVLEKSFEDGLKEVDFMRGAHAYKQEWRPETRIYTQLRFFKRQSPKAMIAYLGLEKIKPLLRRF